MNIIVDCTPTQEKRQAGIGQYAKNIVEAIYNHIVNEGYDDKLLLLLYDDVESGLTPFFELLEQRGDIQHYDRVEELKGEWPGKKVSVIKVGGMPSGFRTLFGYESRISPAVRALGTIIENPVYLATYIIRGVPNRLIPSVVAVHDFAMPKFNYFSKHGWLTNLVRRMEFWYRVRGGVKSDHLITISHNTKSDLLEYFPKMDPAKVTVTYLAADINRESGHYISEHPSVQLSERLPDDLLKKGYFIYMGGGLQKNKNSKGVVDAYESFVEMLIRSHEIRKVSDAPYILIAGKLFEDESAESVQFREYVKGLKSAAGVIFTGWYPDEDKYWLLKKAIGFIHLSLYEGFGIALLEAMNLGVAVIAHNGTSYPEVVGDAGLLVDGTNPELVGVKMFKLYKEPQFAKAVGTACYERSKLFSWKKCGADTYEVLRKVVLENYGDDM